MDASSTSPTGAKPPGFSAKDTGINLVAWTAGTGEFHAIQCKCHAGLNLLSQTLTGWPRGSAMPLLRDSNCGPARQNQPFPWHPASRMIVYLANKTQVRADILRDWLLPMLMNGQVRVG